MSVEVIDTLKAKNNGTFAVAEAQDIKGGMHSVDSVEALNNIPASKKELGMICSIKGQKNLLYQLNGTTLDDAKWEAVQFSNIEVASTAPLDTSKVWFDVSDSVADEDSGDITVLDEISNTISNLKKNVEVLNKLTKNMEPGTFYIRDELTNLFTIDREDPDAKNNIDVTRILRGKKFNMPILEPGQLAYCTDYKELWIGTYEEGTKNKKNILLATNNTATGKVDGGTGSSSNNITGEYIDLTSQNGLTYRVKINDSGNINITNKLSYKEEVPTADKAALYKGLIINQVYGGFEPASDNNTTNANLNTTPVSHDFIELYNNSVNDIDLNGLAIYYKGSKGTTDRAWSKFALKGIVPPRCSFLIRCNQNTDFLSGLCRCKIRNYDMSWNQKMSARGFTVYLSVDIGNINVDNPFKCAGLSSDLPLDGYIDMIGIGGVNPEHLVNAYETRFWSIMDKNTAAHRIDYADSDNNQKDIETINYKTCDVNIYHPRCVNDGEWDLYYNKIKINENIPNCINICYGQNGDTSRTFTWQSKVMDEGYLRYRLLGDTEWIEVESTRELVCHHDCDCTIHRVIIHDLAPGIYEYMAGAEGYWGDQYEFEVKKYSNTDHILMLQTSDQQAWTENEYDAWKYASKYIDANETYDFMLNTGDISQNANRSFEWRYYFKHAKKTRTKCHMLTCGNNDLIDKIYSDAFTYYATFENSPYNSCHSWDIGYVHFVCLNSNNAEDSTLFTKQCEWLENDLKTHTSQRWTICYMHLAPFTIILNKTRQPFAAVFEKYKVDLVLCGHNHTYVRTKAIRSADGSSKPLANYTSADLDEINGVYYVMCQATGIKLSGREKAINPWPWWYEYQTNPTQPSYIMWDISYDKIEMKTYQINGILDNVYGKPIPNGNYAKELIDSWTYNKRDNK